MDMLLKSSFFSLPPHFIYYKQNAKQQAGVPRSEFSRVLVSFQLFT